MPRKPDMPCTECGTLMWRSRTAATNPICRPCRTTNKRTCTQDGCDRPHHAYGYCSTHMGQVIKQQQNYTYTCIMCKGEYATHRKARGQQPVCSASCRSAYINWTGQGITPSTSRALEVSHLDAQQRRQQAHANMQTAACGTTGKTLLVGATCTICDHRYIGNRSSVGVCCGQQECSKKAYANLRYRMRAVRRARKANTASEKIDRYAVFKRDNYMCHLCGKQARTDVNHNHDDYATIDHIEPIAKGGSHTWANVATAHRLCNSIKSDRRQGEYELVR